MDFMNKSAESAAAATMYHEEPLSQERATGSSARLVQHLRKCMSLRSRFFVPLPQISEIASVVAQPATFFVTSCSAYQLLSSGSNCLKRLLLQLGICFVDDFERSSVLLRRINMFVSSVSSATRKTRPRRAATLVIECTCLSSRRRIADVPAVAARLREIRALVAPAAPPLVECEACLGRVSEATIVSCSRALAGPVAAAGSATAGMAGPVGGAGASAAASASASACLTSATSQHRICLACLQRHVSALEAIAVDLNEGCVPCPCPGCINTGWPLPVLSDLLDKATLVVLLDKMARLASASRRRRDFETTMFRKFTRGLGTPPAGCKPLPVPPLQDRAAAIAQVVQDRDLTLRCPRCSLPFTEIDGCNAVLCGTRQAVSAPGFAAADYGCGARFCGICCKEFSSAAATHAHHLATHGDYCDAGLLRRAQNERRAAAVVAAIRACAPGEGGAALQRAVVAALGPAALASAGVTAEELLFRAGVSATSSAAAAGAVARPVADLVTTVLSEAASVSDVACACANLSDIAGDGGPRSHLHHQGAYGALASALLRHAGDVSVVRPACAALDRFGGMPDNRVPLLRAGAAGALVEALRRYSGDRAAAGPACWGLNHLACAPENRRALYEAGAGDVLVSFVREHHESRVNATRGACWALRHLADEHSAKAGLVRIGAGAVLAAALRKPGVDGQIARAGCWALCSLADDESVRAALVADGVSDALMAYLAHDDRDVDAVRRACWTINNLASAEEHRAALIRSSVVEALITLLTRPGLDEESGRATCWILNNLAADDACRLPLLRAGAGRGLVAFLSREPPLLMEESRRSACWALHNLAACDEAYASLHADGAGDAVIAILRSQYGGSESVRAACWVIHDLVHAPANCQPMLRSGAGAVLAAALRRPEAGSELTRIVSWTVSHLASGLAIATGKDAGAIAAAWGSDHAALIEALRAAEARWHDSPRSLEAIRAALVALRVDVPK